MKSQKVQSVLEYCIFISIVVMLFAAIQLYAKRGLNSSLRNMGDVVGFQGKTDLGYTNETERTFLKERDPTTEGSNIVRSASKNVIDNGEIKTAMVSSAETKFRATSIAQVILPQRSDKRRDHVNEIKPLLSADFQDVVMGNNLGIFIQKNRGGAYSGSARCDYICHGWQGDQDNPYWRCEEKDNCVGHRCNVRHALSSEGDTVNYALMGTDLKYWDAAGSAELDSALWLASQGQAPSNIVACAPDGREVNLAMLYAFTQAFPTTEDLSDPTAAQEYFDLLEEKDIEKKLFKSDYSAGYHPCSSTSQSTGDWIMLGDVTGAYDGEHGWIDMATIMCDKQGNQWNKGQVRRYDPIQHSSTVFKGSLSWRSIQKRGISERNTNNILNPNGSNSVLCRRVFAGTKTFKVHNDLGNKNFLWLYSTGSASTATNNGCQTGPQWYEPDDWDDIANYNYLRDPSSWLMTASDYAPAAPASCTSGWMAYQVNENGTLTCPQDGCCKSWYITGQPNATSFSKQYYGNAPAAPLHCTTAENTSPHWMDLVYNSDTKSYNCPKAYCCAKPEKIDSDAQAVISTVNSNKTYWRKFTRSYSGNTYFTNPCQYTESGSSDWREPSGKCWKSKVTLTDCQRNVLGICKPNSSPTASYQITNIEGCNGDSAAEARDTWCKSRTAPKNKFYERLVTMCSVAGDAGQKGGILGGTGRERSWGFLRDYLLEASGANVEVCGDAYDKYHNDALSYRDEKH